MATLYFKTASGDVGVVRNVPPTGGGLRKARAAMRVCHYTEINEAEYVRLKAEIEKHTKRPEE